VDIKSVVTKKNFNVQSQVTALGAKLEGVEAAQSKSTGEIIKLNG